MAKKSPEPSRYSKIVQHIFDSHYAAGIDIFEFGRAEIDQAADALELDRVLNVGDVLYSFKFRQQMPVGILESAGDGNEWIIESIGIGKYQFRRVRVSRILPQQHLVKIKIPEATPELVARYALGDEQALLAKIRYNRLIDIFLGITSYSLQNHLRTVVRQIGQIEIDELYVGVDQSGTHYVVPVQAKGGSDKIGIQQARQDIAFCSEKWPDLVCRAVAAQFMANEVIAMFELRIADDELAIVKEKHFKLVSSKDLAPEELREYRRSIE